MHVTVACRNAECYSAGAKEVERVAVEGVCVWEGKVGNVCMEGKIQANSVYG